MAEYTESTKEDQGLDPTTSGDNRPFWDDRFVEPKQQHRFTVKIPIYTPMGADKDTRATADHIIDTATPGEDARSRTIAARLRSISSSGQQYDDGKYTVTKKEGVDLTGVTITADNILSFVEVTANRPGVDPTDFTGTQLLKEFVGSNAAQNALADSIFGGPGNQRYTYESGDGKFGLYMRVSEYIGYAFKPPGFSYSPGDIGKDGQGNIVRVEGLGTYGLSSATLTFVTTLRDDLHFSLALLWALSTSATDAQAKKSSVRLFDPKLTARLPDKEKIVTIYEHYARPTVGPDGKPITPTLRNNKYAVAGVHKLYDPVIESMDFGEFTYGGAELIKVTMNLTFGDGRNQSDFYSYQNTNSRYGNGTVYAMDQGEYNGTNPYYLKINPSVAPLAGSLRDQVTRVQPNFASSNSETKNKTLQQIKEERRNEQIGLAKERLIMKEIFEGDNIQRKNELFTKAISDIIADREAAQDRARQADADVRRELDAAGNELLNEMEQRQRETDAENQAIRDHIHWRQEYLERDPRGRIAGESRAAREDYEARRSLGTDQASLRDALARRRSRASGNQSSSGTNVSEFGRED